MFQRVSGDNFRGGRKLSPKPSAFESEIYPPHKPSVYAPGYFALPGTNSRRCEITVRKSRTVFIHAAPKDGAHGWCCCLRLHFSANV